MNNKIMEQSIKHKTTRRPQNGISKRSTTKGNMELTAKQEEEKIIKFVQQNKIKQRNRNARDYEACTTFGRIEFISGNKGEETRIVNAQPYIRIADDTDEDVIFRLMTEAWNVPPPKMLLSITGGAQKFALKQEVRSNLKRDLLKAVSTIGAWIVTGGTKSGVMEFVGEAVQEHITKFDKTVVALGISTWGILKNRKNLCSKLSKRGCFNASYITNNDKSDQGTLLDPHHTHFLLVDDGTEDQFGGEIKFRSKFESYISHPPQMDKTKTKLDVPVIVVLVEGGPNSLKTVLESVENGVPVLILDGSGRSADFIARCYDLNKNKEGVGKMSEDHIKNLAIEILEITTETKQEQAVESVKKILEVDKKKNNKMITVYSIHDTAKTLDRVLQEMLFEQFVRIKEIDIVEQLNLVEAWDRCDIAEEEIFTRKNKNDVIKLQSRLEKLLKSSLIKNRKDFVSLVLDYITDLERFVGKYLHKLFIKLMNQQKGSSAGQLFDHYMKSSQQFIRICHISCQHSPTDRLPSMKDIGTAIKDLLGDVIPNSYENEKDIGKNPLKDLFIWAIVMNRKEIAMQLWKRDSDYLCSALYASSLLKALSKLAFSEGNVDLGASFREDSRFFEHVACNVMTELYEKNKTLAHDLLVKRVKQFGNTTLFSLAETNQLMVFMGHTACQTKLNIIWKGNIAQYTYLWRILICFFLPVLIPMGFITIVKPDQTLTSKINKVQPINLQVPKRSPKTKYFNQYERINPEQEISIPLVIYYFYGAPITKFIGHMLTHVAFLIVFSLFVLTELYPLTERKLSVLEIVTWGWTISMFLEQLRQVLMKDQTSAKDKFQNWISNVWNKFDLLVYFLFYLSVILRLVLPPEDFFYARLFYTITLAMYILRSMQFFLVSKDIGPKVIMIGRMIADIVFFFMLFALFVFSFGIIYQATRFPNSEPSWQLFKDIIYIPYWQLYGELFIDNIEAREPSPCTFDPLLYRNGTLPRCPFASSWNSLVMAVYLILTNILLVNVLIAMFTYTFEKVQENSELVWKFHRFAVVHEYYDRPVLAPPLIVINHIYRIIKFVLNRWLGWFPYHNEFQRYLDKEKYRMDLFERDAVESYNRENSKFHRYRSKKITYDDDSPEDTYEHEFNLKDQLELLNAEVEEIQKGLNRIQQDTDAIKNSKNKLLVFEVPRAPRNPFYVDGVPKEK